MSNYDLAIIGGGLAGLSAALTAEKSGLGIKTILIESSDRIGGRVKTDLKDGFLLDHGFQVFLSAYPYAQTVFNDPNLEFRSFSPGAYIASDSGHTVIGDPNREPSKLFNTVFSSVGSLSDKYKIWKLSNELKRTAYNNCFNTQMSTLDYLKEYGFSNTVIKKFFQPFFGGIFLERELSTNAGMFRFVFKNFSIGNAVLPKDGMESLPKLLESKLQTTKIRLNTRVSSLEKDGTIATANGEKLRAEKIILASDPSHLMPQLDQKLDFHSTTTFYFKGSDQLKKMNTLIGLDTKDQSPINNFTRLDEVQSSYAPKGKSLWSVTSRHEHDTAAQVQQRLAELINCQKEDLELLADYKIKKALPVIASPKYEVAEEQSQITDKIYLAGDYLLNASIEGALLSGKAAATAVSETLELNV